MATTTRSEVPVRRLLDRSQHRKPLSLWISRRTARNGAGPEEFVTQVRFGKAEAAGWVWIARNSSSVFVRLVEDAARDRELADVVEQARPPQRPPAVGVKAQLGRRRQSAARPRFRRRARTHAPNDAP